VGLAGEIMSEGKAPDVGTLTITGAPVAGAGAGLTEAYDTLVTLNKFAVGAAANGTIVICNAPLQARRRDVLDDGSLSMPEWPAVAPLTVSEALNLAAWLVAVTGRREEFNRLLDAIERT
jgi:hypothetical protein